MSAKLIGAPGWGAEFTWIAPGSFCAVCAPAGWWRVMVTAVPLSSSAVVKA
jgi:hypothetical protein